MKKKNLILSGSLFLMTLLVSGCLLVSGTFVIVETVNVTLQSGFYSTSINLTNNADWEDHRDKLDKVEVVGFELWVTNNEPVEWSFWAYMDNFDSNCTTESCANASTTKFLVFDTLTIPAASETSSTKIVSYAESFQYIQNLDEIKQMVFDGSFNFYGYGAGGQNGNGGTIDSIRVIITVNASET